MKKYYIAVLAVIVAAMFVLPADARSKKPGSYFGYSSPYYSSYYAPQPYSSYYGPVS